MKLELLSELNAERADRRTTVLITDIETGRQRLLREEDFKEDRLAHLLLEKVHQNKSGLIDYQGRQVFLAVQTPPVKVIAIGAVHISQALASMVGALDLDLVIVDPRTAFATPERFPGVHIIAEWPGDALPRLRLDRYTALAVLSHDPKIDDPALIAALRANCFYIGALGSRKTHARRIERLMAMGFSDADLGRIHAPIGLDIGAASPAEIALSILAEIVVTLRAKRREEA